MAKFIKYQANRPFLEPTPETLNGLEAAIEWAESYAPRKINSMMNELCFHMALVNQGFARKLSYGPSEATRGHRADLGRFFSAGTKGAATINQVWGEPADPKAWKIPVRRITGNYYISWKVRPIARGVWQLYNDSREAYFIEFGISRVGFGGNRYVPAGRIRRPIRKLSLMKTMEYMMATRAYHRCWASIFVDPALKGRGHGFSQTVQPASDSHSIFSAWDNLPDKDVGNKSGGTNYSGPMLGRRLP